MLLAAENHDGDLGLLLAPAAEPGTPIRADGVSREPGPEKISIIDFSAHELRAGPGGITCDGATLVGADLTVDRRIEGRLR